MSAGDPPCHAGRHNGIRGWRADAVGHRAVIGRTEIEIRQRARPRTQASAGARGSARRPWLADGRAARATAIPARAWPIGLGIEAFMMADSARHRRQRRKSVACKYLITVIFPVSDITYLPLTFARHEPRITSLRTWGSPSKEFQPPVEEPTNIDRVDRPRRSRTPEGRRSGRRPDRKAVRQGLDHAPRPERRHSADRRHSRPAPSASTTRSASAACRAAASSRSSAPSRRARPRWRCR